MEYIRLEARGKEWNCCVCWVFRISFHSRVCLCLNFSACPFRKKTLCAKRASWRWIRQKLQITHRSVVTDPSYKCSSRFYDLKRNNREQNHTKGSRTRKRGIGLGRLGHSQFQFWPHLFPRACETCCSWSCSFNTNHITMTRVCRMPSILDNEQLRDRFLNLI